MARISELNETNMANEKQRLELTLILPIRGGETPNISGQLADFEPRIDQRLK